LKLFLLTAVFALFPLAAFAQTATPSPVEIEDVYLAKDDGNGKAATTPTSVFLPTDIPIYCIVQLDSTTPTTVKMNLVAESVPGVKADTKVVSTSYTTKNGQSRVNFYGRPDGKWAPGKYRADIFVEGKLAKNVSFEIQSPSPAKAVSASRSFQPAKNARTKASIRRKPLVPFTAQNFRR
jgi:hypothetical protein